MVLLARDRVMLWCSDMRDLSLTSRATLQMNLLPYLSKLPEFQRREPPPIFFKRERGPPHGH